MKITSLSGIPSVTFLNSNENDKKEDSIFVGYPNWWYDLPMCMVSFLESYDLSGKTIVPFFSHNGSSSGAGSLSTLESICPNSNVLTSQVLSVAGSSVDISEQVVRDWVNGLTF